MKQPTFPFFLDDLACWVRLDPDMEFPGETRYEPEATIYLREYDERVLFHECLHIVFASEREARAVLGEREERIVRHLTRALFAMGWRWKQTDRSITQLERELNATGRQRDDLARELDGADAPARNIPYRGEAA